MKFIKMNFLNNVFTYKELLDELEDTIDQILCELEEMGHEFDKVTPEALALLDESDTGYYLLKDYDQLESLASQLEPIAIDFHTEIIPDRLLHEVTRAMAEEILDEILDIPDSVSHWVKIDYDEYAEDNLESQFADIDITDKYGNQLLFWYHSY
jgi:hypothetical protein